MASNELIVDDEYCRTMGNYFIKKGSEINSAIIEYVSLLEDIKTNAIVSGDVSDALGVYIEYAWKLVNQVDKIGETVQREINSFLVRVDEADQYLF